MTFEIPTKKFIPKICQEIDGKPAAYTGFVIMKVPDFDQRNEFFLSADLDDALDAAAKAKRDGSTDSEVAEKAATALGTKRTLQIMKNIKDQLDNWVDEISIVRLDDNFIFDDLNKVRYDSEVGSVVQEMINELLGKYRMGNPNMPQS